MPDLKNGTSLDVAAILGAYDTLQTAEMPIIPPGGSDPIGSVLFAGPGHDLTIQQSDSLGRAALQRAAARDAAIAQGDTWKPPVESIQQIRARNVVLILDRIIEMKISGKGSDGKIETILVAREMIKTMLSDPNKSWLYQACRKFLDNETSFTKGSAAT